MLFTQNIAVFASPVGEGETESVIDSEMPVEDDVLVDIESHVAGADQSDDITIMSFNYK